MNECFLQSAIVPIVPPGKTVSGFVFTNRDLGAKYTQVELVGPKGTRPKFLSFLLPVPGRKTHYDESALNARYKPEEIASYDEQGLRSALERLPCCTTNADGAAAGDPLNLVFIGEMDAIFSALFGSTVEHDGRSGFELIVEGDGGLPVWHVLSTRSGQCPLFLWTAAGRNGSKTQSNHRGEKSSAALARSDEV
jgi:hypothetical protein